MSGRDADLPLPPRDLASRVFAIEGWSDPDLAYLELGAQTKRQVVKLLPDDWSWEEKRVLDFGSGAGRTLRHFAQEAQVAEFWGCDIDGPSITWLNENLNPPFHGWKSTVNPPLGLEHGTFDLIYAVSVFTHLTFNSALWLLELHRMLKPDGLLIATYMGRWNSEWFASEPWVEDRIGFNVLHHMRDWDDGGPAVLISDWWMREHWGRAFEIVELVPQFQNYTWVALRKRPVELSTEELERPSDDPREYASVRHNLVQVQRELVKTRLEFAETKEDLIRDYERRIAECEHSLNSRLADYENSMSWRITQPLREVAQSFRRFREPS